MNTTDKEFAMANEIDTSGTAGKIAVMQAFAEGKRIQVRMAGCDDPWTDAIPYPVWKWPEFDYRIAPQPKTRPLRASDWDGLPVIWVRSVKEPMSHWAVTGITERGFMYASMSCSWCVSETEYLVWSTDRKTWKPFTVEDTE